MSQPSTQPTRPLRFSAFVMNTTSHIQHGLWRHPQARQGEFSDLSVWAELARTLERGKVDLMFFADVVGLYGPARGDLTANAREGLQFPNNDPSVLVAALAAVTQDLGFAITSSTIQAHPFEFARRMSTLDHLSGGRIGWNVVTSSLEAAALNFGHERLEAHDERYARADEYLEVVYKLWEGSWDEGALVQEKGRLVRDPETGRGHVEGSVYADAARIHRIDHDGPRYRVAGPHLSAPSPQRTPVIFQAGSSPTGRRFAARHAEGQFILSSTPEKTRELIEDTRGLVAQAGRDPRDLQFFLGLNFITGPTEAEARQKEAEIDEYLSADGFLIHSNLGYDAETGEQLDPDTPLNEVRTEYGQSHLTWLREIAGDREPTIADLASLSAKLRGRVVGTPEQIADRLAEWQAAGVDGINVMNWTIPGSYEEFVDEIRPALVERGLAQEDYAPGTLRSRLSATAEGPGRDRLPAAHPAAQQRGAFA